MLIERWIWPLASSFANGPSTVVSIVACIKTSRHWRLCRLSTSFHVNMVALITNTTLHWLVLIATYIKEAILQELIQRAAPWRRFTTHATNDGRTTSNGKDR